MNEIDALRMFRADATAPSSTVRGAARRRLEAALKTHARSTRPPAARRPWALPGRLAGVLATAGALGVAALTITSPWRVGPDVLERARAALDPSGRILHVVVRVESDQGSSRSESWVRADGSAGRTISLSGGPLADCVGEPTRLRCWDADNGVVHVFRYHPEAVSRGDAFARVPQVRLDRPGSLSPALSAGFARVLGGETVRGRPVYAVELAVPYVRPDGSVAPRFLAGQSSVLYLDRDTYYPVAHRFPAAASTTFYEAFEFLPDDPGVRAKLRLPAPAGAKVVLHPVGEAPPG